MKLKMKYTADPWFYNKNVVTGKGNAKVADVYGDNADERNDNMLLITCSPEMVRALLAEEAFCCMPSEDGSKILESLGYREGSKYDFVKSLRKTALKKLGLITE